MLWSDRKRKLVVRLVRDAKEVLGVGDQTAFKRQGRLAAAGKRWGEAEVAFREHLKRKPRDAHVWLRLANVLKDSGQFSKAEEIYARALQVDPIDPQKWLNRGHLAKLESRLDDAAAHYLESFRLDGNPDAGRELRGLGAHVDFSRATHGKSGSSTVGRIDTLYGRIVTGWAVDPGRSDGVADIEIEQAGAVVGRASTGVSRPDVAAAGFGASHAGFRVRLTEGYSHKNGALVARIAGTGRELNNSPFVPPGHDVVSRWLGRWEDLTSQDIEEFRSNYNAKTDGLKLSIVMPVYNTNRDWLIESIDSVLNQICSNWELICVDDGSSNQETIDVLTSYVGVDDRIKVIFSDKNVGISASTNIGINNSTGDFIAFLDHDDIIEVDAVYRMLDAASEDVDLIYSDEVIVGECSDTVLDFCLRPSFSYDYYLSHPYFVHFVAVRREIAIAIGGLDEGMSISMDVDFILRVLERARGVAHVPAVLYRWRTHPMSAGHVEAGRVMGATAAALERHHDRCGRAIRVSSGATFNTFRGDDESCDGRVLVVIPTKDRLDLLRPCVDSIIKTTDKNVRIVVVDHESKDNDLKSYLESLEDKIEVITYSGAFNYSAMNNLAFYKFGHDCDFVLFVNNDVEAISSGWLEHMRGLCAKKGVGAVGAVLLYEDNSVQHGGVVIGVGGPAEHLFRAEPFSLGGGRNPGYLSGLVSVRDVMASTGACLMVGAGTFRDVGGFDEGMPVGFNDVDLCLKIRQNGEKVLVDGHAVLYHYESATRARSRHLDHPEDTARLIARWGALIAEGDPYFHPFFGVNAPASSVPTEDMIGYRSPRIRQVGI